MDTRQIPVKMLDDTNRPLDINSAPLTLVGSVHLNSNGPDEERLYRTLGGAYILVSTTLSSGLYGYDVDESGLEVRIDEAGAWVLRHDVEQQWLPTDLLVWLQRAELSTDYYAPKEFLPPAPETLLSRAVRLLTVAEGPPENGGLGNETAVGGLPLQPTASVSGPKSKRKPGAPLKYPKALARALELLRDGSLKDTTIYKKCQEEFGQEEPIPKNPESFMRTVRNKKSAQ